MQNLREESHISPRPETGGHLFGLNYPDVPHLITLPPISSHLSSATVSETFRLLKPFLLKILRKLHNNLLNQKFLYNQFLSLHQLKTLYLL